MTTVIDARLEQSTIPYATQPLGDSPQMREVLRLAERVARSDASVLITGESGSGKKLVAQFIHARSARATGAFECVDCGALSETLLEATLFGTEKNGVSNGVNTGVLERAKGGTLLLDGITEMRPEIQARLVRIIEAHKLLRCEESDSASDHATHQNSAAVRIIAIGNRSSLRAEHNGKSSANILYRLAAFPIDVPPLRERDGDVRLLAENFLATLNSRAAADKCFSPQSLQILSKYQWPGNVRELKRCIEQAYIATDSTLTLEKTMDTMMDTMTTEDLENGAENSAATHSDMDARLQIRVGTRIDEMERSLIEATLQHFQGNKRRAAGVLGCSVKTLYNKLNEYSRHNDYGTDQSLKDRSAKMYGSQAARKLPQDNQNASA